MIESSSNSLHWWALIGPRTSPPPLGVNVTPYDKTRQLASPMRLGPIALRNGERRFVERTRAEPRVLDGWIEHESWPVFVEGSSGANIRLEFDTDAATHVRRAAMLVSLAWQEPWHVRSQPIPTKSRAPTVPESDPVPRPFTPAPVELDPKPTPLPEWLPAAWSHLETNKSTGRALLMWHEGFLIEPFHPSLALLAYAAAVEAISNSSWADKVNPTAPSGATARFKSTIRLVADNLVSAEVLDQLNWYSRRSATVHGGLMHGHELGAGPLLDTGMSTGEQPQGNFAIRTVPTLRSLTSRLIELSLRELSPPGQ